MQLTCSLPGLRVWPRGRRRLGISEPIPGAGHGPGGLWLVTEGYIRSPPLPPTLLVDRGDTPARPPVDPRPNPVDRFICIYQVCCAGCSKTLFFTMFRGLRRPRLSPNRAPVVSVMRAARTGLIDVSWVLGTREQPRRNVCSKMI